MKTMYVYHEDSSDDVITILYQISHIIGIILDIIPKHINDSKTHAPKLLRLCKSKFGIYEVQKSILNFGNSHLTLPRN